MKTNRRTHWLPALLTLVLALTLAVGLSQPARAAVTPETWNGAAVTTKEVTYMDTDSNGLPTMVTGYKYFATMRDAWQWACAGYPIRLTSDWTLYDMTNNTLDMCLEVPAGKTVTVDLNGHFIDRGLTKDQYRDNGSIFEVGSGATLNITDSSREGGGTLKGGSAEYGGAICANAATLRVDRVTIEECYSRSGTIYASGASEVKLNGVTIQNCVAGNGSAVRVVNCSVYMENCAVNNCTLDSPTAEGAAAISISSPGTSKAKGTLINTNIITEPGSTLGSGIFLYYAELNMTGGSISGFRSNGSSGGAIQTNNSNLGYSDSGYKISLTDVDISNCSAPENGGAIYLEEYSTFTMEGGSIQNCTADGGSGGAIYASYCNDDYYADGVTLTDVDISNCSASDCGGAIYLKYTGLNMTRGSITDCKASGNYGGGIYAYYANSDYRTDGIWLKDVKVAYCQSAKYGGGLYAQATDLRLDRCDIAGCQSQYGGGIYAEDCNSSNKSLDLNRTDIHGCQATKYGGGIYADHSILSLDSCAVNNNTAQYGGGIYTSNSAGENVDLFTGEKDKYASLSGNYASLDGGGLYSNGGNCSIRIGTQVENNTAGRNGGGIFINYHDLTVKNGNSNYAGTRISNNRAAGSGGGIYFNGRNLYLEDDTAITGNRADTGNGGGVYMNVNSALALGDTLEVTGNRCGGEYGGGIYAGYAPVTLSGAVHITANYAGGNADDLCMDGELTVGDIVCDQTGMNLMKNARVGLSSVTNRDFRLGLAATTAPFYCTDPDMDLMEDLVERSQDGHATVQYDHVGVISAGAPSGNKYYFLNWGFDSFEIEGQTYCDIDRKAATIHVTMPAGTDLTNLTALIDGKTVEEWTAEKQGKSDLTMVQAGDFSRPIACMMKRSGSSNFPYIWYITVDCAPVNYAAYTFPVSYNNKGELIQSSQRHYYDSFEKAWETANRMNCGVGLEKDLQLSAPLTVTGKVVLDLNGRTIDRGLTAETENGYAFQVNTNFTVQDTSAARTGTVTGCNNGSYIEGGVFRMKDGVTLKLVGGNYTGNFGLYGSVVYLEQNSRLRVNGTTFADNEGWFGGVISMGLRSQAKIYNATFRNNEALYNGGAISLFRAYTSLEVGTSTFTGNKAGEAGGAIYCLGGNEWIKLADVTITGNHAGTQGGGIILDDGSTGSTFDGVTVKDNTCGANRETRNRASNLYLTGGSKIGQLYHLGTIDNDIYVGTDDITKPVAYCVCYPKYLSGLHTSESGWYFNYKAVDNTENYDAYVTQEEACAKILGVVMKSMPDGDNTVESMIPQIGDAVIDHQARTITVTLPYNANLKRVILTDITLPSDGSSYSPNPWWGSLMDLRTPQMIEVEKDKRCLSVYTITAQLQDAPAPTSYTVTVSGGTGTGSYAAGSTVSITANAPGNGYTFDKWTVTTGEGVTFADANAPTTTFTMPAGNVTVTATYKAKAVLIDIPGVAITAPAPVAGQTLATPTTSTEHVTEHVTYSWQGTEGTPVNNTATCNSTYLLMVTLQAEEGHQFPVNAEVTFNDSQPATRVYKNEDGTLTAYYAFPKTGKDTLTAVAWPADMTIKQGETPSLPDRVAITTQFGTASAAKVTWSPAPAAQNTAGTYTYIGTLNPPDTFSDPNNKATKTVTVTVKAPETVGKITITPVTKSDGTVEVTLSCATEGATIRYTVDGARPDSNTPAYEEPFTLGTELLEKNGGTDVYVLRVIAEKAGMTTRYDFQNIAVTVRKPTNTVTVTGGKVLNTANEDGSYDVGSTVAVQAAVPADKVFKNWSGTYGQQLPLNFRDANAATTTFTMPKAAVTITANFVTKLTSAALTMTAPTSGETLTLPETATYNGKSFPVCWATAESDGTLVCVANVIIPADLDNGVVFASNATATLNGESKSEGVAYRVDSDGSLAVSKAYVLDKPTGPLYSITQYSTASTGAGKPVGSYPAGSTVTITAPTVDGYRFYQWQTADASGESAITVAGLTESTDATASFTMPAKNFVVIACYRPLVTKISFAIPAPEAGQPFAQYPSSIELTFQNGNTVDVDETVRAIFWGTEHTAAVFGTQYLAIARLTEEDISPFAFADNLTVEINGVNATNAVDVVAHPDKISYYDLSGGMLNVSYAFVDPTPATLTGLPTLEPIHNVTPGTAYSALGLPTSVEVQTSCGPMVVPVVWQSGTAPDSGSCTVTGTLTYPAGLTVPESIGSAITVTVYVDAGVVVPDTVATPTAVPLGTGGSEYENRVEVSLYCATPGATIYYTTGGAEPTTGSSVYSAPITLTATTTIKAMAVKESMTGSAVAEFTYTVAKTYPVYYSYEGTRYLVGRYKAGTKNVTVTAENLPGKTFKNWNWTPTDITLTEGDTTAKSVKFTMPANEVVFTPQYHDESIITALTIAVPPLVVGQSLPNTVDLTAGELRLSVPVSWSYNNASIAAGTNVESGKTYTATVAFAGSDLGNFRFSGMPRVTVQNKGKDGSLTENNTASSTLNNERSITVTFNCGETKSKLLRINLPDLGGVPNGTSLEDIKAQLGSTLTLVTDSGNSTVEVTWSGGEGYDASLRTEQKFDLTGTFAMPVDIDDNGIGNTVTVSVTVSARGFAGAPIASIAEGAYTTPQTVTLSSMTPGATIYYTTDGTAPTEQSMVYAGPITLRTNTTLKAVAMKTGMSPSIVSTYVYTFYTPGDYTGGSSGGTQTTVPVSTGEQSYKMPVTTSGTAVTMKTVDQTKLDSFFEKLDSVGTLNIDFTGVKGNTTSAQIPAQILSAVSKALQEKGTAGAGMSIALPKGSAEFDAAATKSVAGQAGDRIQLTIIDVNLSAAQKTALKDMTTYGGVSVTLTSNGKTITTFDGGTVLLKVPFTVPAGQKAEGFSLWYVPENGAPEKLRTTYRNGNLETRVSHFSEYVIAYDEADAAGYADCGRDASCPLSAYADLNPAVWYHDGIHYCLDTGLMNGVGDGKFNPTGTTSRAMVVTMLWRMAGSPKATENSTFTDVPTGTWYTEAAAWGAENGIINGYNGSFDPNGAITREQLAAMLYRYAKTQDKGFTGMWMMQLDYPDAGSVSDWAYEAMCWMTMNGVINGKDGKLVPTGAASRAEAAAMLQRFTESMQ